MVQVCTCVAHGQSARNRPFSLPRPPQTSCAPPSRPPTDQASATPAQTAESPHLPRPDLPLLRPAPPGPPGKPLRRSPPCCLAGPRGAPFLLTHRPRHRGWKWGHRPSVTRRLWAGWPALIWTVGTVRPEQSGGFRSLASGWKEPAHQLWASGGQGRRQQEEQLSLPPLLVGLGGPCDRCHHPTVTPCSDQAQADTRTGPQ